MRSDMAFLGFQQPWRGLEVAAASAEERAEAARERIDAVGRSVTEPDLASVVEAAFGTDVTICDLGQGFDGCRCLARR